MRITGARLVLASSLALCLTGGTAVAVAGAGPSPAVLVKSWAWATVRQPAANYVPAVKDRGNLLGAGAAVVNHLGVGSYRVDFAAAITPAAGIAHVSTFGSSNRVCVLASYGPSGATAQVFVRCTGPGAVPADSMFTVAYLAESGGAIPMAYLEADQPGLNYFPVKTYNSAAGANSVQNMGVGQYRVILPGLGSSGGDIQVTPETPGGAPRFCEVDSWATNPGGALVALIRCYKPNGVLAHAKFTFSWGKRVGLKGDGGTNVAYTLASQPGNPGPYAPPAPRTYNSTGGGAAIVRSAVGRYVVEFPGMPQGGAAVVTPYGAAGNRCFIRSIRKGALPQRIGVGCVNGAGGFADTRFMVSYLK